MNLIKYFFPENYDDLWKAVIRPHRDNYKDKDLGPEKFEIKNKCYKRTDFTILNKRNLKLQCSFWEPFDEEREYEKLPCVIYLHGNSSSRCEVLSEIKYLLPLNITVFSFDFSGCGRSEGEYISLGWYEKEDVSCIIEFLRKSNKVSTIGIWGRSMGAVTALLYGNSDPSIAGLVLDSAFSSLNILINELAKERVSLPNFILKQAVKLVKDTVKEKAGFILDDIEPKNYAKNCFIPAYFCHAKNDTFVGIHHCKELYNVYAGDKNVVYVKGNHNTPRPRYFKELVAIFFQHALRCSYMEQIERGENFFLAEIILRNNINVNQDKNKYDYSRNKKVMMDNNIFDDDNNNNNKIKNVIIVDKHKIINSNKKKDDDNEEYNTKESRNYKINKSKTNEEKITSNILKNFLENEDNTNLYKNNTFKIINKNFSINKKLKDDITLKDTLKLQEEKIIQQIPFFDDEEEDDIIFQKILNLSEKEYKELSSTQPSNHFSKSNSKKNKNLKSKQDKNKNLIGLILPENEHSKKKYNKLGYTKSNSMKNKKNLNILPTAVYNKNTCSLNNINSYQNSVSKLKKIKINNIKINKIKPLIKKKKLKHNNNYNFKILSGLKNISKNGEPKKLFSDMMILPKNIDKKENNKSKIKSIFINEDKNYIQNKTYDNNFYKKEKSEVNINNNEGNNENKTKKTRLTSVSKNSENKLKNNTKKDSTALIEEDDIFFSEDEKIFINIPSC